ncbi:hypothetical protein DYB38_013902 [Aphanomyces astaci]|uniref:Uncharacterized protein n=1 Tax=Aphanomyces astaci TaxID=112090 RepID=A0A397DJ05_APHAT|nr:hypothetical protein DYB38_013902 [Aphanomyces astaci]
MWVNSNVMSPLSTSTTDEATANDSLYPAAALPLPPPSTSPPPLAPQALPSATSAPALPAAPQPPAPPPDNPRLLAAPLLSPDHPVVAPMADCTPQTDSPAAPQTIALHCAAVARTCASSRAHVEELAVGEAHRLDQALTGSTENPLGVNRAPCTCVAADSVACPRGGECLRLPSPI